jgi:TusA-related sulfurtransferase
MTSADRTVIEFDIRGQICPATLLIALREVNRHAAALKNGTLELLFLTATRDSTQTIPESVGNMGFCVDVTAESGYYVIKVTAHE